MKNLFAIPRLSLSETFTILITLVVCLVGFNNAEVYSNHRKRNPNQRENENFLLQKAPFRESVPYSHETPKISNELEEKNFANLRNLPESPLDKLFKRHSDYFGESEESDSEKEGDGYGYDDDEYYHFNFKRNDDISGGNENIKSDKEAAGESNDKDALKNDKSFRDSHKDVEKETETIEMLNFKETHTGGSGGIKSPNKKPYSDEPHQKQYGGETSSSLKMSDLRENSAVDEKVKERKDSGGGLATDQKIGDGTSGSKSDDKDVKIRDVKHTEEAEKNEKDSTFKEAKDAIASKSLKESSRVSDEKEKNAKLNENDKFEESVDKMEGKGKELAKVAKDEEEITSYSEKLNADGLSEMNSRANFESDDYKESVDGLKIAGADEEEKNSYEMGGMDKTVGLEDYQEITQPRDRKQYKVRESHADERLKTSNRRDDGKEAFQDETKMNEFLSGSHDFDTANVNPKEFFKKSQFWKDVGLRDGKSRQQQKVEQEQSSQEPQEITVQMIPQGQMQMQMQNLPGQNSMIDMSVKNPFGVTIPRTELESGENRKSYIKSLKKLKSFSEDSKGVPMETSVADPLERSGYESSEDQTKNRRSMPSSGILECKGKAQNKYSNSKRDAQDPSDQSKQRQVYPREHEQFSTFKSPKDVSMLSEGKNEEHHGSGRLRRKSPQKFEYEIKVINQNKDDPRGLAQLSQSHYTPKRVEKDLKSKLAIGEKYLKKYPYSQVSRDDLTKLNKMRESEKFGKSKRKAPISKRHDQNSNVQTRAVPFGYYGNRVKFGQKSNRNNEKIIPERSRLVVNSMVVPFVGGSQTGGAVDLNQRMREEREDNYKHDTAKRFDDSGSLNKGNSLLLVKKDERVTKSFDESTAASGNDNDYTSDALAKILAKDNDFLILKRTESNKFQKVSEAENNPNARMESFSNQLSTGVTVGESDNLKPNSKQSLQTKPFHSDKDDKKYAANLHGSNPKSNLKKTFEKFRDLAGFFKDNEQESADNPVREAKEGRDIVFSEDKLPDPIVISSDPGEKFTAYKTKPQNSIYSISTNFKALDQQEKRKELRNNFENHNTMFTSAGKADSSEFSWEPTLKSMFPEAKTINSTTRNGNEIIVLDLNRNQLRRDHQLYHVPNKQALKQPFAPFGSTAQLPLGNNNQYPANNQYPNNQYPTTVQFPSNNQFPNTNPYPVNGQYPVTGNLLPIIPGNRRIQIVLDNGGSLQQDIKTAEKSSHQEQPGARTNDDGEGYTVLTSGENQAKIILPFSDINNFSSLIRNIFDKKDSFKAILKKSTDGSFENKVSETYSRFLKDLSELTDVREKDGKKEAISDKRNPNTGKLYVNTLKQFPPGGEETIKYLGNLLQNLLLTNEAQAKSSKDQVSEGSLHYPEDSSPLFSGEGTDAGTGHWSSVDEKGRDIPSVVGDEEEYVPKAEDTVGLLEGEESMPTNEKNPEEELWEELAAASDKIHRLRREGKGKRKRKALSLRERHQASMQKALPETKSAESRSISDSNFLDSKQSEGPRDEDGNDLSWVAKLRDDEATRESSDLKSRFESHLRELIEGLNENKNQKEQLFVPNESAWSRKKRKDTRRRKRSTWSDVKNKVSTTAVQNTILKNLAEDNYHSVYSPGIKRRLLSTDIEAEDADSYSDENERDKNVIAEEPQAKCVKNSLNECIDPMIIELFRDEVEEEKNRARRSLAGEFHSDFKREIDLDESMPNDFQNFLVTSLGAFGSQKREVVKKDEALGEGKETFPDNYNRGKEATEDSALEKREVSSDDNQKISNYKKFYSSGGLEGSSQTPTSKTENSGETDEQSGLKMNSAEALDDKLPTQIRIQVTNARGKEKKSFKPILEDDEAAFGDTQNEPKDKEFFDKTNPFRKNSLSKLRHYPLKRYNYNEYSGDDGQQASYRSYRRRLKKKKYNSETSIKPLNDYMKYDHKPLVNYPRRVLGESNVLGDHTTQKSAVSNHLPQVETVYNPTQGTNKAQLESARLTKVNSISNKNTVTARTTDTVDRSRLEDGILKSYLKEHAEKLKCNKIKDFEDWKSPNSNLRFGQDFDYDLKNPRRDTPLSSSTDTTLFYAPYRQKYYTQRRNPTTANNPYVLHSFPKETVGPTNLYDALKVRQEMKNRNSGNRERPNPKPYQRMYHNTNSLFKQEENDKSQNAFSKIPERVGSINVYDYTGDKKSFGQWHKTGEYFTPPLQTDSQIDSKSKLLLSSNYGNYKTNPLLDALEGLTLDSSKELDYPDALDDDYGDDDLTKEGQFEDQLTDDPFKKSKMFENPITHRTFGSKSTDVDDLLSDDDEEMDDDYEENTDEDDLDDFIPLTGTKPLDKTDEHTARKGGEFYSGVGTNPLSAYSYPSLKDNLPEVEDKFGNSETNVKFGSEAQLKGGRSEPEIMSKSSSVLKRLNENSHILGDNVFQHVHGHGDVLLGLQKIYQPETSKSDQLSDSKLNKRKLDSQLKKRSRETQEIGNRIIYAAKSDYDDSNAMHYPTRFEVKPPKNNYRLTKEHFLDAQFAGPGNDYENESEEKGKYFNQINFAKNGFSQKNEESDETEDVKENLEDDGETISEDNILENVIGKYIMRKTVKGSADQASKRSANKEKSRENRHEVRKRSAEFSERVPKAKVLRRRLSSGHLTENNFRKYHKKNLTRKRQVRDQVSVLPGTGFFDQSLKKRESEIQSKRSALDLLKKLTNKDRDKKGEMPVDSRTAGFEPLSPFNENKFVSASDTGQEKKFAADATPKEAKNSLAETKSPLRTGGYNMREPLVEKKKSKVALSGSSYKMQGPWKVELNDKCGARMSDASLKTAKKGVNKVAAVRAPPSAEEPKCLKGFLVLGKNSKSPKRYTEEALPSSSGSYLKEVGSSGSRPNSEEGRGTSKKYIRKRYLRSSADRTKGDYGGAGKASGELNDKERGEDVSEEETNRALHDRESFAEGGSSQPSQGLQRNSKMSFVTADDQSKTSRFFSKGRLVKRKSAFPPSNDANIIRDSRHVNEETSEYLGQQVVNAILSHVSANPRFKEMIAPGLAPRTPNYKQENYDKDYTLQQVDFPDHLQYFLQRFMYDLEKLAERRVKKRMCNQIDKQAKQFLEFLLAVPTENIKTKSNKEDICPIPGVLTTVSDDERDSKIHFYNPPTPECTTETRTKPPPLPEYTPEFTTQASMSECTPDYTPECTTEHRPKTTPSDYQQDFSTEQRAKPPLLSENSYKDLKAEIDNLRKKCCLLLKLIVDYQNLSKLEKEVLDTKYHNIMQQLDRINQEIKTTKGNQDDTPDNQTTPNEEYLCCGYKIEKNQPKNCTIDSESKCFQTTTESFRGSTISRNKKPKQFEKKKLPKLYFEEMKNPAEPDVSTTTCLPVFERVSVGKLSELRKEAKGKPSSFEITPPTTMAPNSFDLLLCSNNTMATNDSKPITTTTTRQPTTCTHFSKSPSGPSNTAEGDSLTMIMNSIPAINSGSNVHPTAQQMQERKKRKKFAPYLPGRRKKRSNWKGKGEFKKPEGSAKRSDFSYEEEYTGWSSMPPVRRILNNLESGFQFDDLLFKKPKRKKLWRRGEKKPD